MEPETHRQTSQAIWEAMAPGWERWRAQLEEDVTPLREWMIRELAPKPGDTILELSAGAGDTGFAAAAMVGADGRLISSDFAADMVEVARRRGAELGLENVEYRVIDAERIDLDDDSVDGVLCRWGYMLMADPAAALSETRRVLRPGKRLVLSVFGSPAQNPWAAVLGRILVTHGVMQPPELGTPSIFGMASEEHTRALLLGAGFTSVRIEEIPVSFVFQDTADYMSWAFNAAGGLAVPLRALSDDDRNRVEDEVRDAFTPFETGAGHKVPAVTLNAVAS
jgi:ubiquinone/menaquinone biosynthesis C-methylase UbiE